MTSPIFQPIPGIPALFIKEKNILVLADLHIGIESELCEQGLHVASQTQNIQNQLHSICNMYHPTDIVLLGDLKHTIPTSTNQERRDVQQFLQNIHQYGTIHIVPGNHDGNINWLLPEGIILHPSSGMKLENIGFLHGHRWPEKNLLQCTHLLLGHTHPTIQLKDRLGYKTYEPCWLKGRFQNQLLLKKYPASTTPEIIILPAFNPLCGGIAANADPLLGPVLKLIDIQKMQVFLLDGTDLGKIKDIH